jgi:hypothetical protein
MPTSTYIYGPGGTDRSGGLSSRFGDARGFGTRDGFENASLPQSPARLIFPPQNDVSSHFLSASSHFPIKCALP